MMSPITTASRFNSTSFYFNPWDKGYFFAPIAQANGIYAPINPWVNQRVNCYATYDPRIATPYRNRSGMMTEPKIPEHNYRTDNLSLDNPTVKPEINTTTPLLEKLKAFVSKPEVKETTILIALNIAMAILKVRMFNRASRKEGFSLRDRKLLNTQEQARQVIGTIIWLASLSGTYLLTDRLFPGLSSLGKLLTSTLISALPDAFIRPALTAKILKCRMKNGTVCRSVLSWLEKIVNPLKRKLIR